MSAEALDQFANDLLQALEKKDAAAVAGLMDESTFVARASGAISDLRIRAEVERQARFLSAQPFGILSHPGFLRWRLVQSWVSDGKGHVLFNGESESVDDYLECRVEIVEGRLQGVDVVLALRERPLSMDLSSFVAATLAQKDDTPMRIARFNKLVDEEKYEDALQVHATFAPSIKKHPLVAASVISIGAAKGLNAYADALQSYILTLPSGTPTDSRHIKAYYYSGRYEEMIVAIREVKKRLRLQDSRLDYVEGVALSRSGRPAEGRALLLSTLERQPDSEDAAWGLMKIAMLEGDYEEGAVWLDKISETVPDLPALVREREDCQAFLETPVGRAWMKKAEANG